jgi:phosphopantothenoylcysteine decarboxylase/phosphopantothenate--cysteine ligase
MKRLEGKTVLLAVSGSIAAYKAVEVARLLVKAGARVRPVMTASSRHFLGATTLSGVTGETVHEGMWDPAIEGELHVMLARGADLLAVVPATADRLAVFAHGRAEDLLGALALCVACPTLVVPAMHPRMWAHAATQANVAMLVARGVRFLGPVEGDVASGERGLGRMAEPAEVFEAIVAMLGSSDRPAILSGRHIVVTAGPTVEDLDPVRFFTNRSSGKMGFAIAEAAARRGARVTLVAGPVALATPRGVERIDVRSALDMQRAVDGRTAEGQADALVMAAAVADFRPAEVAATKIKKQGASLRVDLVRNPDILAEVGARRAGTSPVLVGFALETGDEATVEAYARGKLEAKRCDLIVANEAREALESDSNRIRIFARGASGEGLEFEGTKQALAERIVDALAARMDTGEMGACKSS